jgi:Ricin-type beta-trefoil lectin domain-like
MKMRITFKNIADHSKIAVAALLMSLLLGAQVFAQIDRVKPLDEDAVAALVEKLGGLLSHDIKDEDKVSEIINKWGEREDLVGKTQFDIMNMLWGDVKSVLKDTSTESLVWLTWILGPNRHIEKGPALFKFEDDGYSGSVLAILYTESEQYNCREEKCPQGASCHTFTNCDKRGAGFRHRAYQSVYGDWRFEPAGEGYYYIFLGTTQRAIVAGDNADNRVYFQAPNGRDNAKWKLVPLGDNRFYITDKKHGLSLAAGNNADGNIYHQAPNGRRNAIWRITYLVGEFDIPTEIKVK